MKIAMRSLFRVALAVSAFLCVSALPALAAPAITTTTLAVSSAGSVVTTVSLGAVITLTAAVRTGTVSITTGRVNFCDAAAPFCTDIHLLATAQLTSTGTATYKFVPGIGNHSYKAIFLGTSTSASSFAAAAPLTVTGKFPTAVTLAQTGVSGNYNLTATVLGYVNSAQTSLPTGTVSFLDATNGNSLVGMAPLVATAPAINWKSAPTLATGSGPQSVVAGDFNGDGKLDLATANAFDNTITILLGNGDGTFTAAPNYVTGYGPYTLVVADFNGDGKADLVVGSSTDITLTILLGHGDGTFSPMPGPVLTCVPWALSAADLNGDGNADLAVVDPCHNVILVLLGNGDGTFTSAASPATGSYPTSVAVGDFNGDGKSDLVVSNYFDEKLTVLLGKGDGTFSPVASLATDYGPASVVVADFNQDGNADIAVADRSSHAGNGSALTILLGNGDGTFTPTASPITDYYPQALVVGDFNGDGLPDLATANTGGQDANVLLGNGDGTFASVATLAAGNYPQSIVAGDFDGDGVPDLAVDNSSLENSYTSNSIDNAVMVFLTRFAHTATATVTGINTASAGLRASYAGDTRYLSSASGLVGNQPALSLSASTVGFGDQTIHLESSVQIVTVTNSGSAPLKLSSIALTGAHPAAFLTSNNCGSVVAANSSCNIRLRFDPTSAGPVMATLAVSSNAGSSPQLLWLTGTGVRSASFSLSPSSIAFGNVLLNSFSSPQTVTLTNTGTTVLHVDKFVVPFPFALQSLCLVVFPNESCDSNFLAIGQTLGPQSAKILLYDNSGSSPQSITATATVVLGPLAVLSASAVTFAPQRVNAESAAQTVTLTNTGDAVLAISSIALTGAHPAQYLISNTCPATLASSASCTIRVRFRPSITGSLSAAITITDNAATSPQSITLSGTGVSP